MAHPLQLRAIASAKKKNDRVDAATIADCLRCNFLPYSLMRTTENQFPTSRPQGCYVICTCQIVDAVAEGCPQFSHISPVLPSGDNLVDPATVLDHAFDLSLRFYPFLGSVELASEPIRGTVQIAEGIV